MTELTLVRFNEEEVVLDLPEFKRRISEKKFLPQLHEAVESTIGFDVEINLISAETPIVPTSAVQDDLPQRTHLPRGHEANTFDTFVVGSSNRYPHAAASWVAENPGKGYNPLMIYGNAGLGKTHLLSAIFHEIKRRMPNASIIFTTGESFANEIIAAIRDNAMTMVHEKYRTADVFLVDDVQFIAGKERTQEEFFHTFNILVQNARQIVLTADKPPKDIPGLEDRLVSRFNVGLLADIQ
ncbi:MAG: AAA family ATPase, partial [Oscillospiraceae bacterium]|nr:AAA family ATPase [Oscillospiraceae bacterium]